MLMEVIRFINIILISHSRIDSYTLCHCDLQLSSYLYKEQVLMNCFISAPVSRYFNSI